MRKSAALVLLVCSFTVYASHSGGGFCDTTAGVIDSHVLGLMSQPGFCRTYGYGAGKAECMHLPANSYQANHLSLHGLWPNQNACGQSYGFCGVQQRMHHCSYPALYLSPEVSNHLKKIMPSYNYGSCLERHEWNKHGSCQDLNADEYFALAMRLTEAVNDSVLGQYVTSHSGETVSLTVLKEMAGKAFGQKNVNKIYFACRDSILVDVHIQLPASIPFDQSLESLIDEAPYSQLHDACPGQVILSDFHKGSLHIADTSSNVEELSIQE